MNVVGVSACVDRTTGGKGFGLEVQEESIREWAEKNGLELVAVLRDAGVWGTREAADRPGLSEAVSLVEIGEAKGIVVARLDRLARTLVVQDGILGKVWSMWARVDSTDAGEVVQDDPDDPMRTALRQIIGVFAQMERGMIAARLRAGRRPQASQGRLRRTGPPAMASPPKAVQSFRSLMSRLSIARMSQLRVVGMSLRAIAAQLDLEDLRPRRATRWVSSSVGRILARLEEAAEIAAE